MAETEDYDKSATPLAHKTTHENGGSDEISVDELSGQLADDQPSTWALVSGKPTTYPPDHHKTQHQLGGGDTISVAGLSGLLGNAQTPLAHTHVKTNITDTPWAWTDISKVGSNLTDIATRSHTALDDIGTLTHSTLDGYLDQAVKQASSPIFAGLDLGSGALLTTETNITQVRLKSVGLVMKNIYTTASSWARALLNYTDDDDVSYFQIGARGVGQTITYGYIGTAYNATAIAWLSTNYIGLNGCINPLAPLQIGTPYASEVIGNVPLARFLGNVQSQTTQTLLRLNRPVSPTLFYSGGVDFNVLAYGAGGSPYSPKTQLDICLKASTSYTETANVTIMTLLDSAKVGIGMTPIYNLDVTGNIRSSTGFGCNGALPQTPYASGGALAAYVTGAFGLDTAPHMSALHALVVAMRAALVANGIMS
jgi:hypothetical protein